MTVPPISACVATKEQEGNEIMAIFKEFWAWVPAMLFKKIKILITIAILQSNPEYLNMITSYRKKLAGNWHKNKGNIE